ncbi:Sugar kinase of the NBD/HSP70 family, may contain an N-terminal HTH domain [Pelagibacterium halotolerans]|nr:Sugar kinase of the NBD/HSP70 family, may contain an N-terminal HTH domain [Pelagibacterium halotolerans]
MKVDRQKASPRPASKVRGRSGEAVVNSLSTVLTLVRTGIASTRQEIERESELGRAVVADRLATLTGLDLVDESELGAASGGRAPRLVRFNADIGRVLVATLDQTALGVGIADLDGHLLMEHHEAIDLASDPSPILNRLIALFEWVLEKHQNRKPVWGVGLSVPGPVAMVEGADFLCRTPEFMPGWEGFPFVERLLVHFNAPVWMRSSVETMTMGELKAGGGVGQQTMLFIKVGTRIGAGIAVNGTVYRGAQGAAGLIGQIPVATVAGSPTLEAAAGSTAIAAAATTAALSGQSPYLADTLDRLGEITAIDVGQAAQMGDSIATELLSKSGRLIGETVAALTNMINPALIVLGGSAAQTSDTILAAVREAVYRNSHPLVTRDLRILRSQMGSSAGLVGAAAVVTEQIFSTATLRGWITQGSVLDHPGFQDALDAANQRLAAVPTRPQPPAPTA